MKSCYYLERIGIQYSIRLNEGVNTFGRTTKSTVKISGPFGSRNHCHIVVEGDAVKLEDFSSNGTFINEVEFRNTTTRLQVNDKIGIGVFGIESYLRSTEYLKETEMYHLYILRKIVF